MPKNSRPDIQVLEARVVRLKAQLLEYADIRTYEITKQRLSNVALELEECISIISAITGRDSAEKPHEIALEESDTEVVNEFDEDGDLGDVLFTDKTESESKMNTSGSAYSSKYIVGMYASQLQKCSEETTGIIQINQLSYLMNSWFQARFVPPVRNPKFYYKANRIHEWIDLMILSAGKALHEGKFSEFKVYVDEWIESLNTSKDEQWILPLKVRQIEESDDPYTTEAVLAEKIIKKTLYTDEFYSDKKDSVAKIVMQHCEEYTEKDFEIDELVKGCSHIILTSSFDASKYR